MTATPAPEAGAHAVTHPTAGAPIEIIANGNAGSLLAPDARETFLEQVRTTLPTAHVTFLDGSQNPVDIARRAIDNGATIVVAGGGDGTVNAVASAVFECAARGIEATLGVLPLGTLNHFAHDVGIPAEVPEALQVIAHGHSRQIDVGQVNERIFVNNSGLGLYPDMVFNREERQRKGASKWPAAFSEGVRAFMRYKLLTLQVTVDGRSLNRRTPAVFVGNNEYTMQGTIAAERPSLSDGILSLYIPHPTSRARLIVFSLHALFGNPESSAEFDRINTTEFTINCTKKQLRVSIDGEVTTMDTPLAYRTLPGALRVLAPAVANEAAEDAADARNTSEPR